MTTGTQIWDRAVEYADMVNSSFPTSDTALRLNYVNTALSQLHYKLAELDPDYFHAEASQPVVAGVPSYALPSDFYKLKQVYLVDGSKRYMIDRFQHGTMDGWENAPLDSGSLALLYVPAFSKLAAIGDAIGSRLPPGWEEWCSLKIAIKLLMREESDVSTLTALFQDVDGQIAASAAPIDSAVVDKVVDTGMRFYPAPWLRIMQTIGPLTYRYRIQGSRLYILQPDVLRA